MVKISLKRELVIHSDVGLVGTFVSWSEKSNEKGYKYLTYVPLNSFPPKKKMFSTAIHNDHIHTLHSSKNEPGVENRIIFIYTGESGSLLKSILDSDNLKTIAELREKNRKLQMQVASTKQSEEDARSGVNKQMAAIKTAQRGSSSSGGFDGYPQRPQAPYNEYDEGGFDNF